MDINHHFAREAHVSKVVVVTSGKGGVGKTTTTANIAAGIAQRGKKTVAIDFDVGLRNLDLVLGCERRVVYDFVNVIKGEAKLNLALIRDKRVDNLYVLPASQTRDKDALEPEGVGRVIEELRQMGFDYIICDSPAGIEKGAQMAMYFADEAIVVANPEVSSVRDSDRVLGLLAAKTSRAEIGATPIKSQLLLTRYSPLQVKKGEMLSVADVLDLLGIPLLGVIPESKAVLQSSNKGTPAILDETTDVSQAYLDVVYRFLGEEREHRFIEEEKRGIFRRLFG
jgi:septum site-determining protein MinD